MEALTVLVSREPLRVETAVQHVMDASHGAIDTFVGTVRNHHEGKSVTGITYDVHRTWAEKIFRTIAQEAARQWVGTRYYVAHAHGDLPVSGISVIIAVSSAHRAASFEACRYVIEQIKQRAPIWKKEHYTSGSSAWLPVHALSPEVSSPCGV